MTDSTATTRSLLALSNQYRRQLLLALRDHNPQDIDDLDPMNVLASEEDPEDLEVSRTQLIHVHLPKLEEMRFIDWNPETGTIKKGPDWEEIDPILQLLLEHREELPKGWL